MFIKPFKVKNNIQVKSSDVKKLKTRLNLQFKHLSENDLSQLLPSKASCQSVKIVTHNEEQVTVFTVDKRPMFFEYQDRMFPTLYALWVVPTLVFNFTTHPQVLPKLANGANLMMPGIVKEGSDLKSFGRFQRDQIVAVNLTSNRSSVAVGTLARDSEDLYMSGGHGICVNVLHVFGDKLWGMEPSVTQQVPLSQPVLKPPSLTNNDDFPALGADPPPKVAEVQQKVENLEIAEGGGGESTSEGEEEAEAINPDEVLKKMFLSALKLQRKELANLLPIIVAVFYPTYVLKQVQPNCTKPITIKDTSYKKVSTFIKKMAEEGFVVVREENKGVEKIVSINFEHPELLAHYPIKPDSGDAKTEPKSHLMLTKMTELYVVNDATKKLFNALGVETGKSLDSTQIKNFVKDYVSRKKLLNGVTKEVTLDDVLYEMCVGQRAEGDDGTTPTLKPLDQVIATVHGRMETTFEMRSQNGPVIKGGKKPIIQITTATRMGNKKVTLISNLEAYGINVADFSKACKIGVQASTSITKVPGTNINQFQIQGNHVRFIYTLLTETYQVAKGNISGLEFAKKDKSGKKK